MQVKDMVRVTTFRSKAETATSSWVGYYIRKRPTLVGHKWVDSDEDETIFGLCNDRGLMTHMCYGQLVLGNDTWEDFAVTGKHARKFSKFYFDAGGNGYPIYITYNELRHAMVELELIDPKAINYCQSCLHSELVHCGKHGGGAGPECCKIADENEITIKYCECAAFVGAETDVSNEQSKETPTDK